MNFELIFSMTNRPRITAKYETRGEVCEERLASQIAENLQRADFLQIGETPDGTTMIRSDLVEVFSVKAIP